MSGVTPSRFLGSTSFSEERGVKRQKLEETPLSRVMINDLPEEVLLKIFFLCQKPLNNLREMPCSPESREYLESGFYLSCLKKVCTLWNRLAKDKILYSNRMTINDEVGMAAFNNTARFRVLFRSLCFCFSESFPIQLNPLKTTVPNLTELKIEISEDKTGGGLAIANRFADSIKNHPNLKQLNLQIEGLEELAAITLLKSVETITTLTSLQLFNRPLGDRGGMAVAAAVGKLPALTQLRCTGDKLGGQGAMAIVHSLQTTPPVIKLIHLQGNQITDAEVAQIASAIKPFHSLEFFDIIAGIKNAGMFHLANAFSSLPLLKEIFICGNFGDEGAIQMAKVVASLSSVEYLSLESCEVGEEGAEELNKIAKKRSNLTIICD
jgi:hypothetical protein